jgi:hypothetical protein
VQLSYLIGMDCSRCRPTETFTPLAGVGQASPSSFPQNLPFKLGEDGQQSCHCTTGWCGQIQSFGQGNETDAQMFQFLKGRQQIRYRPAPAVQSPHQHYIDLSATGGLQQFLASFSPSRAGADLTELTAMAQPRRAAYSRMARLCMDSVC